MKPLIRPAMIFRESIRRIVKEMNKQNEGDFRVQERSFEKRKKQGAITACVPGAEIKDTTRARKSHWEGELSAGSVQIRTARFSGLTGYLSNLTKCIHFSQAWEHSADRVVYQYWIHKYLWCKNQWINILMWGTNTTLPFRGSTKVRQRLQKGEKINTFRKSSLSPWFGPARLATYSVGLMKVALGSKARVVFVWVQSLVV